MSRSSLNKKWEKRFSRWFKLRFAILYPLGLWALISAYSTNQSIIQSLWVILAGLGIRTWANGYAIKLEKLTTCGPYAHVRHPLYLGTFLVLLGFMIMLRVHWIVSFLILLIVIGFIYSSTIKSEERMLEDKFGQDYLYYKKNVPAFIFRIISYKGESRWPWDFSRYFKSQEYKLFIWSVILIIVFHFKEEFLIEKEKVIVKHVILMFIAGLLISMDLAGEYLRKRKIFEIVGNSGYFRK